MLHHCNTNTLLQYKDKQTSHTSHGYEWGWGGGYERGWGAVKGGAMNLEKNPSMHNNCCWNNAKPLTHPLLSYCPKHSFFLVRNTQNHDEQIPSASLK